MNREKVICACHHVTAGEIEDAVKDGAASFKEVKKLTKAGKSCGKCKKKVKKFMEAILEEKNIENPECAKNVEIENDLLVDYTSEK